MLIIPNSVSFRFNFHLVDSEGAAIDLTDASSVAVIVKLTDAVTIPATITNATGGAGYADAPAATFATPGEYSVWARVDWADGRVHKSHGTGLRVVAEGTIVQKSC